MRIGTTPTHTFTLPIDTGTIKTLEITYEQNGKVIMQKRKEDCEIKDNIVKVKLTQEDTFKFRHNEYVRVQVRALREDGLVLKSQIEKVSTDECLSREVLT